MNVSFLNPSFLWGIPLVGIPVLLHLLTRKKALRLPFSETKFIQLALRKTIQRHRLRQYLLLFLRSLIIFFLTLLFARPVVRFGPVFGKTAEKGVHLIFLLDNSYSLGYYEDGAPRINLVKEIAKSLVSKLSELDLVAVYTFSDRYIPLTPLQFAGGFTDDKKSCLEIIERVTLSNYPTDLLPILKESYRLLKDIPGGNKIIVLVSDFGRNGWSAVATKKIDFFNPEVKLLLVDVKKGESKNCALEKIIFKEVDYATPATIETSIENYSTEKILQLPVKIYLDKQVLSGFLEMPAGEKKTKNFVYSFSEPGFYRGYTEIGSDNLTFDDKHYFVISIPEPIKVLAVDGSPALVPVASELYYFRLALNPYGQKGLVSVETLQEKELESVDLYQASLVVLANVRDLTQNGIKRLQDYIESGGNIFIALGDKVDTMFYNQNLDFLLPGNLVKLNKESAQIDYIDLSYPGLNIFSNPKEADFSTVFFSTYYLVEPKVGTRTLIRLSSGHPLLLETTPFLGGGKVLLFVSSLDRDWTNFPTKPVYPILFQEIIRHLIEKEKEIFTFSAGEKVRLSFTEKPANFVLEPISKTEKFSSSWVDTAEFRGLELFGIDKPGVYNFTYGLKDKLKKGYLVVNPNIASGESDLKPITLPELKKIFTNLQVGYISVKENYVEKFVQFLKGKEVTQTVAGIIFVLLILESIFANRFRPPSP